MEIKNKNYDNNNKGALWIKEKNELKYMNGYLVYKGERINITVFKNNYKTDDRHPYYNISVNQYE